MAIQLIPERAAESIYNKAADLPISEETKHWLADRLTQAEMQLTRVSSVDEAGQVFGNLQVSCEIFHQLIVGFNFSEVFSDEDQREFVIGINRIMQAVRSLKGHDVLQNQVYDQFLRPLMEHLRAKVCDDMIDDYLRRAQEHPELAQVLNQGIQRFEAARNDTHFLMVIKERVGEWFSDSLDHGDGDDAVCDLSGLAERFQM